MQLHANVVAMPDQVGRAHAQGLAVGLAPLGVIAVHDNHVAVATVIALKKSAGSGVRARRRNDLDEIRAGREKHVFQAVAGDIGVAMANLETEHPRDAIGLLRKVGSDQADLAQPQVAGPGHRA